MQHGRRLALVVGVNEAPSSSLKALRSAQSDAARMAETLQGCCGFEQPTLLLGEQATSMAVKKELLRLVRESSEHDFLLFYFSGHGYPIDIAEQAHIFLVTREFDPQDAEEDDPSYLSMRWLQEKLYTNEKLRAEQVLLILDCCYAGDMGRMASDPYLDDLKARINRYFGAPGKASGVRAGALRMALTATGHDQEAAEQAESGIMTGLLVPVLRGEVDEVIDLQTQGEVRLLRVKDYLWGVMPTTQKPGLAGDDAAHTCVLARYPERAEQLRKQKVLGTRVKARPDDYLPLQSTVPFQPRPADFAELERHLFAPTAEQRAVVLGVVGMGGIGKSRLASEFAHHVRARFPAGIFWTPATGTTLEEWRRHFAELVLHTDYMPPGEAVSPTDEAARRARHLCRYLATHPDALLILDNVEQPALIHQLLPQLAGEALQCAILYTSRKSIKLPGIAVHRVDKLPLDAAMRLLLSYRPTYLAPFAAAHEEPEAARYICQTMVECLPLALTLLAPLLRDTHRVLTGWRAACNLLMGWYSATLERGEQTAFTHL